VRGIKNSDKILEMKKYRFIQEVRTAAKNRGIIPPAVNFDGELCPGYDGNQWAHYHPDRHVICVPINMLRIMDEFQLKNTAIHEVTHIFDLTHGTSFYQEMAGTSLSSFELPPGVILIYEGMYKSEIKRDKRKERVDKTRCNHHLCRKRRKLTQCPHCDSYYCDEHILPYEPGRADNYSPNSAERSRAYERISMKKEGHTCGGYIGFKKREREKRTRAMIKFLDKGRVEYLIPKDVVCGYEKCNIKLKDERKGYLCRSCNMTFCKEHKDLKDHECTILDLIADEYSQKDIVPESDIESEDVGRSETEKLREEKENWKKTENLAHNKVKEKLKRDSIEREQKKEKGKREKRGKQTKKASTILVLLFVVFAIAYFAVATDILSLIPKPNKIVITPSPLITNPPGTTQPPETLAPTILPPTTQPPITTPPPTTVPPKTSREILIEEITKSTDKFSLFSRDQQEFLLTTTWIQDGLEQSEIEYLESLPMDFNPRNKIFDRDEGGWPDIYEIGVKGDIFQWSDDDELEILGTEYVEIVYYKNIKPRFIREVIFAIEEAAERNIRVLGEAPKVRANIYHDRGEFENAYGGDVSKVIAFADTHGEMHALSPEYVIYRTKDEFSKNVIHEYSHLATPQISYSWLAEGYAQYMSDSSYFSSLGGCKTYDFPLSLEYGDSDREIYRTYDCGHHAVEYIVETYGEHALGEVVKSGFVNAIGISESEFIVEYKANLKF
jgi:predicted nucleic acid binding AN1-type Zn finger protein